MILVDTNLLLRSILQDDIAQTKATRVFFDRAQKNKVPLVIHELAIAEVAWVLSKRDWSRDQIGISILEICADERFAVRDMEVIEAATNLYIGNNVSFIDAFQAAFANIHGMQGVLSFDRDFDKLGTKRIDPK